MVLGLDVVLADGRTVHTGGAPRAAVGPDLTQVFVGSEGTLGIITGARLRRAPGADRRGAAPRTAFAVVRRRARRVPAHPAPRRDPCGAAPLRRDRGRPPLRAPATRTCCSCSTKATPRSSTACCASCTRSARDATRSTTSAARHLARASQRRRPRCTHYIEQGAVVDTMEVAARWSTLPDVYDAVLAALRACDDLAVASAHLSHAYSDGALPLLHLRRLPAERRSVRTSTAARGTRP